MMGINLKDKTKIKHISLPNHGREIYFDELCGQFYCKWYVLCVHTVYEVWLHHYLFMDVRSIVVDHPIGSVACSTLFLIRSANFENCVPRGLGAPWWAPCSLVMIHPIDSHSDLSPHLSSATHQHKSEPQILTAQKQSCLTLRAHIPPSAVDGRTDDHDYLHRDKLSTSFSFILLTGCQHPATANSKHIYPLGRDSFHLRLKNDENLAVAS